MPSPFGTGSRSGLMSRGATFVIPWDFLPYSPTLHASASRACSTPWGSGTPLARALRPAATPRRAVPFTAPTPKYLSHWPVLGLMGLHSAPPLGAWVSCRGLVDVVGSCVSLDGPSSVLRDGLGLLFLLGFDSGSGRPWA